MHTVALCALVLCIGVTTVIAQGPTNPDLHLFDSATLVVANLIQPALNDTVPDFNYVNSFSVALWVKIPPGKHCLQQKLLVGSVDVTFFSLSPYPLGAQYARFAPKTELYYSLGHIYFTLQLYYLYFHTYYINTSVTGKGANQASIGISDGNWHHVALSVNIKNLSSAIFIDGQLKVLQNWTVAHKVYGIVVKECNFFSCDIQSTQIGSAFKNETSK